MNDGQVIASAAQVYEKLFVPALFAQWTSAVLEAARVEPGTARVLDVGCGTGILARAAAQRLGPAAAVFGLDLNAGMLAVAESLEPRVAWRQGNAEALPFEDGSFDAVMCQFALMFIENRASAVQEMHRVLAPGGNLAIAVWDGLDNSPGFAALVDLLQRECGDAAADALRAPFSLGDKTALTALMHNAGVHDSVIRTVPGVARFPSLRDWLHIEVRGWVLSDMIDDAALEALIEAAERDLTALVGPEGNVAFSAPAHIVSARRA